MQDIQDNEIQEPRGFWLRALDYWNVFVWASLAILIAGGSLLSGNWVLVFLAYWPARVAWFAFFGEYADHYVDENPISNPSFDMGDSNNANLNFSDLPNNRFYLSGDSNREITIPD